MTCALAGIGCQDPPAPKITATSASTAPWLVWASASSPVQGPVVIVRDHPGGALDRLVADPDVTTFFNDRFHPVFVALRHEEGTPGLEFRDGCGCSLVPPFVPKSPAEIVQVANTVIVRPDARRCMGRPYSDSCTRNRAEGGPGPSDPGL